MKIFRKKNLDCKKFTLRFPINYSKGPNNIIFELAEGEKNTVTILYKIKQKFPDWSYIFTILEDKNIRGVQIQYAYELCKKNISVLKRNLEKDKNNDLIFAINCLSIHNNTTHKAVEKGSINHLKTHSYNLFITGDFIREVAKELYMGRESVGFIDSKEQFR